MEMPNQMIPVQQPEEVQTGSETQGQQQQEKKQKPAPEQVVKCPRCASTNTKFCYYNNYSLSQPRYFCKACRRYWTQGGALRNVPVGGGCRKNKRPNPSYNSSPAKKTVTGPIFDHHHPLMANTAYPLLPGLIAPPLAYDPSELTLAFAGFQRQPNNNNFMFAHANPSEPITGVGAPSNNGFLDVLRNGMIANNNSLYSNLSYGVGGNVEVNSSVPVGENVEVNSSVPVGQEAIFPCENEGGASTSGKEMDETETRMMMGNPEWQFSGDDNVPVDPARDYWGGASAGSSSWQGIINGSLM